LDWTAKSDLPPVQHDLPPALFQVARECPGSIRGTLHRLTEELVPRPELTDVVLDHARAVSMALTHLHQLGHRRIAFMRGPKVIPDSDFRWEGIQQAAQELNLQLDPTLITRIDDGAWRESNGNGKSGSDKASPEKASPDKTSQHPMSPEIGYVPMKQLLAHTRDFTAIFCFNDIAAIGAVRAIADAGLRCPHDISVIGFDDIIVAEYLNPRLTTVRQPLREMGRIAAEILLKRINRPGSSIATTSTSWSLSWSCGKQPAPLPTAGVPRRKAGAEDAFTS